MIADEDTKGLWQDHLVRWGMEFPSILHLLLTLSALHLSYERPAQRDEYIQQADDHFTFGVRTVTSVISQLNEQNCQQIYMATVLICLIYFGRGPRPGEYLIFSDSGPAEWLVLMSGVKMVLSTYQAKVFSGILEPDGEDEDHTLSPAMQAELHDHLAQIDAVQRLIEQDILDENQRAMYFAALKDLREIMGEVYEKRSSGKPGVDLMHLLIGWLYRRHEEFVHMLEQKEPRALVILAYWAVMLKYMESSWFMEGWGEHVLSGISDSLHVDFRSWIEWPWQKVRSAR